MNIALEEQPVWAFENLRLGAVVAGLALFLSHRLAFVQADDFLTILLVILPALELTALVGVVAYCIDGREAENWYVAGALMVRWFGFVVAANWLLALFIQSTLDAYIRLGGPAVMFLPV